MSSSLVFRPQRIESLRMKITRDLKSYRQIAFEIIGGLEMATFDRPTKKNESKGRVVNKKFLDRGIKRGK